MKKFGLFLLALILFLKVTSQSSKKILDTGAVFSWTTLGRPMYDNVALSSDGKLFAYLKTVTNENNGRLILQSVKEKKQLYVFPTASSFLFSRDNKTFIYLTGDELVSVNVETGEEKRVKNVKDMNYPERRKGELLVCQMKTGKKVFIQYLVHPAKTLSLDSVNKYVFDKNGNRMAFVFTRMGKQGLKWINLRSNRQYEFDLTFEEEIESLNFDESGGRLVFVQRPAGKDPTKRSIWFSDLESGKTRLMADAKTAGLSKMEIISRSVPSFSRDGRYIFFKAEQLIPARSNSEYVKVDVWHYLDFKLKNSCRLMSPITYTFSVDIVNANILRIETDSLRIVPNNGVLGDYVIVSASVGDRYWKKNDKPYFAVMSLQDGRRTHLGIVAGFSGYFYSPAGKYLVYSDSAHGRLDYYAYSPITGESRNLTHDIPSHLLVSMENNGKRMPGSELNYSQNVLGWIPQQDALLIYDSYDVLKLFLSGNRKPENLTNGYGRRNNTRLALTYENYEDNYYTPHDTLTLTAFNWNTKYNGFYAKELGSKGDPDSLSMKPWIICGYGSRILPSNHHMYDVGMLPLKAADTTLWLVKCNSPSSAPNYYITSDLRTFEKLTNVEPQLLYNWYTTQLVHWRQYDGQMGSGVLYKPEDFDSTRRYPVIVYHYRELSQLLYYYNSPRMTSGSIDIPWFVSRGYLVLAPDVYLREDGSGPAAYNSVVSGAEWLGSLPYVDKQRIGLNGHSQGGFQTNYIIAHTSIFAAALSGAGGADAIMSSFTEYGCGFERFWLSELRLGTIWKNPELYIKNSPFWLADKISTPLLLFHCKNDNAVPWALSVQLFLSLWRLEKPVWMLQYDEGGHEVNNKRDLIDYSKRVEQFFDHFLKHKLPPEWMTNGISSREKGINTGLYLDNDYR